MTVEATVATDGDLAQLGPELREAIVEAIREATVDDEATDNLAPARVSIDVDAEPVAEPPEGATGLTKDTAGP